MPEGKLILPILRPGRGNKAVNIAGLLKRLILKLCKKGKHTQIIVRGDSHFCSHDFMDWATDRQDDIHFISGLAGNVKLKNKAGSWKHQQRVVVKIEVNNLGTNVRYVVTDFKGQRSSFIYSDCYCDRGRMEQMISELKNSLNTKLECSTITTMREKLLLSAVSIDEKKTCICIRFSQKAPMLPEMVSVLTRLRHLPPS